MNKAIFLDRDGVINQTVFKMGKPRAPYSLEEFQFIEGVKEAIDILKNNGFILIIVTNQPDVARGWVAKEQVTLVNNFIQNSLPIHEITACFHTEKDNCLCRKPMPGMILETAKKWNINLSQSFMIGDRISDVEAGQAAGCSSILVGPEIENEHVIQPAYKCMNLFEATKWVLLQSEY